MVDEEEALPEAVWYPSRHRPGDEQSEHDVADDGSPLHDEDVRDRRRRLPGAEPVPQGPVLLDRHVHGGMAFHRPGQTFVSLSLGGIEETWT